MAENCHLIPAHHFNSLHYLHTGKNMARKKLGLWSARPTVGNRISWYHEHVQTNRVIQLLCTNPATINQILTNLRQFYCILEVNKR